MPLEAAKEDVRVGLPIDWKLLRETFSESQMSANAQPEPKMTHNILRLPAVKAITGLSRSTIYLRISQGLFPKPVSLGARAVGWPANEVASINAARISGESNLEIIDLVVKLEAARKMAA